MSKPEQNGQSRTPMLDFGMVTLWIVAGYALVATVLVVGGWRLVAQIWLGSGLGLALLLLPDLIRLHRKPMELPDPESEAMG
jgi:hypothetical protein